jgi:hypothetical protein
VFTQNTVTVITAATGHRNLLKNLLSVQQQTYPSVEHFVVIDGPEHQERVEGTVAQLTQRSKPLNLIHLPCATGKERWCGHRIYGAMSFLSNSEFICYLDQDNWFEPDHVASLIAAIQANGSQWAFSLRNIVDEEGNLVIPDLCESLGNLHHVFNSPTDYLVDTSCYMLRREVAVHFAPAWYGPTRPPRGQMERDRLFCRLLLEHCPKVCSNRRHTVNYTVGNRPDSVRATFFLRGNQAMRERYPQGLPWE